jgi:hypothetical protein
MLTDATHSLKLCLSLLLNAALLALLFTGGLGR